MEQNTGQKTSIGITKNGLSITGDQSDYTGMIIGGGILIFIILAVTLFKWGPEKFKGMFRGKNGNGNGNGVKKAVEQVEGNQEKIETQIGKIVENQTTMQQNQALMQKDIEFIKNEFGEVKADQKEIRIELGTTRQVVRDQVQNINTSVTSMTREIITAILNARSSA